MRRGVPAGLIFSPLNAFGAKLVWTARRPPMLSSDGIERVEKDGPPRQADAHQIAKAIEAARQEKVRQRLQAARDEGRIVCRGVQTSAPVPRLFQCLDDDLSSLPAPATRCGPGIPHRSMP
ncbi:MAG: hypothetical protein AAGC92_11695 [Pseudomonadota bacterium]